MNNRSLITGGAGFIGSHLAEELFDAGDEVIILDNFLNGNKISKRILNNVKIIEGDIRDIRVVREASMGCNKIYHFAAFLGVDLVAENHVETMVVESLGTQNIVKVANENQVEKIIYASTSGVYGKTAIEKSVKENFIVDPRTSYSIAKRYNEIYLQANWLENQLESICIRYFNVYGERQDTRMVIPRFVNQAIHDKPITIYGNGKQTRDFTYVKDVAKATRLLSEKVDGFEIFNMCGKNEFSIYEVAKKIKHLTKSNSELKVINMPGSRYDFEVERRSGNSEKLFHSINFLPNTTLDEGLKKSIKYSTVCND